MPKSSFKGLFEDHLITLDSVQKKLGVEGGAEVTYTGEERDLEFKITDTDSLYFDVTRLKEGFVGPVRVGIKGRTKRVLWNEILIQ